jgi:GNAT superfamily N-acetyltransferase
MAATSVRDMTDADTSDVLRLIDQLHPDRPGTFVPSQVRQGWRALVAEDEDGVPIGFLLGTFIDYGLDHESCGTLEQLVVDASARGRAIGRTLVEEWKQWLRSEGLGLGFLSADESAISFYESCGFGRCTGPWMAWVDQPAS